MGALRPGLRWGKGGGGLPWRESHEEVRVGWWWAAMVGGPWGGEGRQPARAPSWPSKCPGQWAAHQGILPEGNICGKSTLAPCFKYFFFFLPPNTFAFWILLWRNVPTAGTQGRAPGWRNRCPLECLSQVLWDLSEKHLSSPASLCGLIKAFWAELAVLPLCCRTVSSKTLP